jgi:PAS domain S-box-containing protein
MTAYSGYLIAFVVATAACLGAAWRARSVTRGDTRRALVAFFSVSGAWAASYIGFLLSSSALEKHIFYQLSLIVGFAAVFAWLWFCSAYSGRSLHRNRKVQGFALAVYLIVTALKVTNPWHGLYYGLEPTGGAFGLVVTHETLYWVVMSVAYALSAAGYLMIYELFLKAEASVAPLAALTGLTALPAALNVIGHVEPSLLDITHEPLGVAVFAIGLLFAYETQFSVVQLTGSVDDPNLTVGPEGRIRGLGGGIAEIVLSLSMEDLGRPLAEVLPCLDRALQEEESVWEASCAEETRHSREETFQGKTSQEETSNGETRYYQIVTADLQKESETQTVILSDITERKRREQELREKERRFQAMLNDPNILAVVLQPDGTFQDVNDTALEYTEETREDILGRLFWDMPWWETEDESTVQEKVKAAAEGKYVNFEAEHVKPSGEVRNVTGVMRPVTDEDGKIVSLFVTARDITERKRKAQRLREAKEEAERAKLEAEEASQMKSAMLANMSHEVRTPLTSIIGFAEVLNEESDRWEGPIGDFAQLIEDSGRRLLNTLDGVLNLSKLEAGKMELSSGPVDLAEEARAVARQLRPKAEEKELRLEVDAGEYPTKVWADEGGVQIVLQNLISNAIKYTEEGEVQVRIYRDDGNPTAAVLEVEDTGIGMDPEGATDLFEPFRQASEGMSREYEGTGIGLAVTRRVAEEMGASIEVETEEGAGSRFTVRFPLASSSAESPSEENPSEESLSEENLSKENLSKESSFGENFSKESPSENGSFRPPANGSEANVST